MTPAISLGDAARVVVENLETRMSAAAEKTTVQDQRFWRASLAGEKPQYTEIPEYGFYRLKRARSEGGGWGDAVAFWYHGDAPQCSRAGKAAEPSKFWLSAAPNPVTYAEYLAWFANGQWHDDVKHAPKDAGAGDNSNALPADEAMRDQIVSVRAEFDEWFASIGGRIIAQDQADKAAAYKDRLQRLKGDAENSRTSEKKPHLDAGRAVDEKWRPIVDDAANGVKAALSAVAPYLDEQRKIQLEAAAAARAAAAEAARAANVEAPVIETPVEKAGSRGRGIRLVDRPVFTIIDLRQAAGFIAALNQPPREFVDAVQLIVNRMGAAGGEIPGVEKRIEQVARG